MFSRQWMDGAGGAPAGGAREPVPVPRHRPRGDPRRRRRRVHADRGRARPGRSPRRSRARPWRRPRPKGPRAAASVLGTIELSAIDIAYEMPHVMVPKAGTYEVKLVNKGTISHDVTFADGTQVGGGGGRDEDDEVTVPGRRHHVQVLASPATPTRACTARSWSRARSPRRTPTTTAAPRRPATSPPIPTQLRTPSTRPRRRRSCRAPRTTSTSSIEEKDMTVAPGFVQRVWTFGGTVPGPGDPGEGRRHGPDPPQEPGHEQALALDRLPRQPGRLERRDDVDRPGRGEAVRVQGRLRRRVDVPLRHRAGAAPHRQRHVRHGHRRAEGTACRRSTPSSRSSRASGTSARRASPPRWRRRAAATPRRTTWSSTASRTSTRTTRSRSATGDRVRVFVLDAGPNIDSSFHIVGTIFSSVIKEGIHLVRRQRRQLGLAGHGPLAGPGRDRRVRDARGRPLPDGHPRLQLRRARRARPVPGRRRQAVTELGRRPGPASAFPVDPRPRGPPDTGSRSFSALAGGPRDGARAARSGPALGSPALPSRASLPPSRSSSRPSRSLRAAAGGATGAVAATPPRARRRRGDRHRGHGPVLRGGAGRRAAREPAAPRRERRARRHRRPAWPRAGASPDAPGVAAAGAWADVAGLRRRRRRDGLVRCVTPQARAGRSRRRPTCSPRQRGRRRDRSPACTSAGDAGHHRAMGRPEAGARLAERVRLRLPGHRRHARPLRADRRRLADPSRGPSATSPSPALASGHPSSPRATRWASTLVVQAGRAGHDRRRVGAREPRLRRPPRSRRLDDGVERGTRSRPARSSWRRCGSSSPRSRPAHVSSCPAPTRPAGASPELLVPLVAGMVVQVLVGALCFLVPAVGAGSPERHARQRGGPGPRRGLPA